MKLSYVLAFATLVAITITTPTNAVSTIQKMRPVRNLQAADDGNGTPPSNAPGNKPGNAPGKGEEASGNKPGKAPGKDKEVPGKRARPDPKTGNRN